MELSETLIKKTDRSILFNQIGLKIDLYGKSCKNIASIFVIFNIFLLLLKSKSQTLEVTFY